MSGGLDLAALTFLYLRPPAGRGAGQHSAGEKQGPGVNHQTSAGSHRGPDTGDRGRQSQSTSYTSPQEETSFLFCLSQVKPNEFFKTQSPSEWD